MLKNELWGCFKYIGIPLDTLMNMPIHDRKFFIMKHNEEIEGKSEEKSGGNGSRTYEGETLNGFARLDQERN